MISFMLIGMFLFLVFAPCVVAYMSSDLVDTLVDSQIPGVLYVDKWKMPERKGRSPQPLQAMFTELPVSEDFEIRSFAKGISQRRIVVRDTEDGPKLSIAQVRAAARELYKLGGAIAAYEFALVAAALVSATQTVADAARTVYDAAKNVYAWLDWGDAMATENYRTVGWDESPPQYEPVVEVDLGSWRDAAQAA